MKLNAGFANWQEVPLSTSLDRDKLRSLLMQGIHPTRRKIEAPLVYEIEAELLAALDDSADPMGAAAARLSAWVSERFVLIDKLKKTNAAFNSSIAQAPDPEARRSQILDYARALGATATQLRGDAKAFTRWFGLDAVVERSRRRIAIAERQATFGLNRLALVTATHISAVAKSEMNESWLRSGTERAVSDALNYVGDARVGTAAFACLRVVLGSVPADVREDLLGEATLRRIYRAASQPNVAAVDSQTNALELLKLVSLSRLQEVLRVRITKPQAYDDFWVRRYAVGMLCQVISSAPDMAHLLTAVHEDPSPAVRQSLALHLNHLPTPLAQECVERLACEDSAPEVRAAAICSMAELDGVVDMQAVALVLALVMRQEKNEFVLRVSLEIAAKILDTLEEKHAELWVAHVVPQVERLRAEALSLAVRRWAAQTRERLWCAREPRARELYVYLRDAVRKKPEGSWLEISAIRKTILEQPQTVARVLSVIAQSDFSFDLKCGGFGFAPKVRRGDRFVFRAWRAWYEFRNPSPDKRQAFSHTIGRVFPGQWHAPSAVMAELAQTKVPGEPFFIGEEAGWRPYLPLPDHALSAIDTGGKICIVTSEGVTEMTPPSGLWRRIRSRILLSIRFTEIARLRNWTTARSHAPSSYLEALENLGFKFKLVPHEGAETVDPSVSRFFPAVSPVILPPDIWVQFGDYFYSLYQNTLRHLAIFMIVVLLWFLSRHIWVNARMRRTRAALPLVLGGWGTRGKSGTERIKAALINSLGYSLDSKTTGNEAMFLYGLCKSPSATLDAR